MTQYTPLAPGDIRQEGDEKRDIRLFKGTTPAWNSHTHIETQGNWRESENLTGHAILASDLIFQEFRRPIK